MNTPIKNLLIELYAERDTWGAGVLSKFFKAHELNIGSENALKRAAEIINVPYVELNVGGNRCKSYPIDSAEAIINYVLNNNANTRAATWLEMHPEVILQRKLKRQQVQTLLKQKRMEITEKDPYISCDRVRRRLKIARRALCNLLKRLNINIIISDKNKKILKKDFEQLELYLRENYSDDPQVKGRQLAADTARFNNSAERRIGNAHKSRISNIMKAKALLEEELHVTFYLPKEAAEYIGKNNSTLVSGMKLLDLPLYKRSGTYLYDEESLKILKNFFLNKNGLKGQLARVFEQKLRDEGFEFLCEKTFPDLYWKINIQRFHQPLRFDYYLPKYNLLVEVQGIQHFRPSTMGANIAEDRMIQNFKELQERDQLKRNYCIKNNINLIEISSREDFNKFDALINKIETKDV